jgi:NPCBM/NEW2 domain/Lectin C-type domain
MINSLVNRNPCAGARPGSLPTSLLRLVCLIACWLGMLQSSKGQAPAASIPIGPLNAMPQFHADFGQPLWFISIPMPEGKISPESNRQITPQLDIKITNIAGALLQKKELPTIAANPGKNFSVTLTIEYQTIEPTKLFANLKLDTILPDAEKQKLMQFHSSTWHYDNESSPGAKPIASPGNLTITMIGTAPAEIGEFEFLIDVGLMPRQTGGLLKKLYPVKLVTKFTEPEPLNPNAVAIHSPSQRIAVGGTDGKVRLLDAIDGKILQTWSASEEPVQSLAFSSNGSQLAVGFGRAKSEDESAKPVKIFAVENGQLNTTLEGLSGEANTLIFNGDDQLFGCDSAGRVLHWNVNQPKPISEYKADGPVDGMSLCVTSKNICAVVNNSFQVIGNAETRTSDYTVTVCRQEIRTNTKKVPRQTLTPKTRELPVDFEGALRQLKQTKFVDVFTYDEVTEQYTVSVPYMETRTRTYTVVVPVFSRTKSPSEEPASVIKLSLPDLKLVGRWTPEGERAPIGTSFNETGDRIYVTTPSGVSVLEANSMLELVDIREKTNGVDATKPIHQDSPFYLASHDAVVMPSASRLVALGSDKKIDDDYFSSLAESAAAFKKRSLELSQSAKKRPTQPTSPGIAPSQDAPPAPKLPFKPLLAKVETDKQEILVTKYSFNDSGFEEPMENPPKVYQLGGFDHQDAIAVDAPNTTTIMVPAGFASFTTYFGLQDKQNGSVAFVILGDGKPLYRSSIIRDHIIHGITLDIRGVKELELVVEAADRGNQHDKALWVDPTLSRNPAKDAYSMKFVELKLTAKNVDPCTMYLNANSAEVFGLFSAAGTEFTMGSASWKPKENSSFKLPWNGLQMDLASARLHIHQCERGSVAYRMQGDGILLQFNPYQYQRMDGDFVLQIPIASQVATVEADWSGPWKVAGWKPQRDYNWYDLPELPLPGTKYFASFSTDAVDWDWGHIPPIRDCPNSHTVLMGERKFKSEGGLYRVETLADDAIRVKLDGEVVLESWQRDHTNQNCRLLSVSSGSHTLRFEYADSIGEKRTFVSLKRFDDKPTEQVKRDSEATTKLLIAGLRRMREIGVYMSFDFASDQSADKLYLNELAKGKSDELVKLLSKLPQPRIVHISNVEISESLWKALQKNPKLQRMEVLYANLDENYAANIAAIRSLEQLLILGGKLTTELVTKLSQGSNVKDLLFWNNETLDDTTLKEFHRFVHLTKIGVRQTKCTLDGIHELYNLQKELHLEHNIEGQSKPTKIGDKQYIFVSKPAKYQEAVAIAKSLGGTLAAPMSSEENEQIAKIAESFGTHNVIWLGIDDAAQEGIWKTTLGQTAAFTHWADKEPNGSTRENYVTLMITFRRWNDVDIHPAYPFLVELNAQ